MDARALATAVPILAHNVPQAPGGNALGHYFAQIGFAELTVLFVNCAGAAHPTPAIPASVAPPRAIRLPIIPV